MLLILIKVFYYHHLSNQLNHTTCFPWSVFNSCLLRCALLLVSSPCTLKSIQTPNGSITGSFQPTPASKHANFTHWLLMYYFLSSGHPRDQNVKESLKQYENTFMNCLNIYKYYRNFCGKGNILRAGSIFPFSASTIAKHVGLIETYDFSGKTCGRR